jgi:ABC-type antimicrobial peptide transport system permease subunit
MSDVLDASVGRPRFRTGLTALFAGVGLLLAGLALFTVIAQSVAERAYEIAVRIALGARPGRIVALVVGRAVTLMTVGVAVGALAALGVSRYLSTLLYEVGPADPLPYGAAAFLMLLAGGLAAAGPARRAVGLNPVRALQAE